MEIMRKYGLILALSIGTCALVFGCDGGVNSESDADADSDSDGDSDGDADAELEFVSDQAQVLRFDESTDLDVRYVDGQGIPIADSQIRYAIDGEARGSSLAALTAQTNADGIATMQLTAGQTNTNFDVDVEAPSGDTISFAVTVSDREVGTILVEMSYSGDQNFTNFRPYLFDGVRCATLDVENLPTALMAGSPVARLRDNPHFDNVDPGDDYTVAILAEVDGEVTAYGCADRIEVLAYESTDITVHLADIGETVLFEGVYLLDNYLDLGPTLPASVDLTLNILSELTDDVASDSERCGSTIYEMTDDHPAAPHCYGDDPGAFIVDLIGRQACRWECLGGENFESCSQLNHPLGDLEYVFRYNLVSDESAEGLGSVGCLVFEALGDELIEFMNTSLESFIPEVVLDIIDILGDIADSVINSHITSYLDISTVGEYGAPFEHELHEMIVDIRDLDGKTQEFRFNLSDAGLSSLTASETANIIGSTIALPDHRFELHFGSIIRYVFVEGLVKTILGYDSTADMLQSWINCSEVMSFLEGSSDDGTSGSLLTDVATSLCEAALETGGIAIEEMISNSVDSSVVLILNGSAIGEDIDETDLAHTLADGVWEGSWEDETGSGASAGNDIEGTFTGTWQY